MLRRDWRAGELGIIVVALVIAVASLVSVSALGDRIDRAFVRQGSALLAADLVVRLPNPPPQEYLAEAAERGLEATLTASFRSVVLRGDATLLAEVKAVAPGYPLRGQLQVAPVGGEARVVSQPPVSGTVWVEPQVLARLATAAGETLELGVGNFTIEGIVVLEPDRGSFGFSVAPRVLMNYADLADTQLLGPGSRVRYRWLIAGPEQAVAQMRTWLMENGVAKGELEDPSNARSRFRAALDRGTRFLGLATLVSLLLAGMAISRATLHYARRHWDHVAMLRCLGAIQREILGIYLGQLLALSLAAGALGIAIGYAAQQVLVAMLPGLSGQPLPLPSFKPLLVGLTVSLLAVVGFGLPALMRLKDVSAMRVIRRDFGTPAPSMWLIYAGAVVAMGSCVVWLANDFKLAAWVIGGTVFTLISLALAARLLIALLGGWRGSLGVSWRFGIGSLLRRGGATVAQAVALGVGVMGLLLLTLVRTDLLDSWQGRLPAQTPNHFLINIQDTQVQEIETFLVSQGAAPTRLTPLVRARLKAINGDSVDPLDFAKGFARRMVERAANLSSLESLPDDNRLVAGSWWGAEQRGDQLVSVEREYARALGLEIGDDLSYEVAGSIFTVRVSSLREVSWDSFRPNFFLLVPPALLEELPKSYITSFYLHPDNNALIARLVNRFPNVTDVDVDAVLQQVRRLMERVNASLQFIFMFALLAGLLVLFAAIQTTRDERQREIAVLRALGASRAQVRLGLIAEYAVLGLLSGTLGAGAALLTGYGLAEFLFDMPYRWSLVPWLAGIIGGSSGIALAGYLVSRADIRLPAWRVLRQSE